MFQIVLKGWLETDNPDELIASLEKLIREKNAELHGQFQSYNVAPFIDYQKADDKDTQN